MVYLRKASLNKPSVQRVYFELRDFNTWWNSFHLDSNLNRLYQVDFGQDDTVPIFQMPLKKSTDIFQLYKLEWIQTTIYLLKSSNAIIEPRNINEWDCQILKAVYLNHTSIIPADFTELTTLRNQRFGNIRAIVAK